MRQAFIPRPYQTIIIEQQLDNARCGTWAGMGLGKTVSSLSALDIKYISGQEHKPALVLAPKRVAQSTWPDEAAKWDHLRNIEVKPIIGTQPERLAALRDRNASVFTINYENIPWLMETLGDDWPFGPVISDESTKLKSFRLRQGSKRAAAIAPVAHTKIKSWVNLTGTPSPNGLADLWGQTWFLDQGVRLGRSFNAFQQRWFQAVPGGDGYTQIRPLPFAQVQIEDRLKDICLTLDAKDYFDIKDPIESTIYIELPAKAREVYKAMEKEMFAQLGEHEVEAFNAAAKSAKCHQLANGAAYVDPHDSEDAQGPRKFYEVHDLKLQALESIIEEAAGMPVLVAYHFKSDLARLHKAFPRGRVLDDNPQTIRDWNAGKIPILFAHPASAGHGLNLQDGGNIVVYFSIDWNLEYHQQILERIGPTRQLQSGYDRPVFVYYILARDTVDEQIKDRLEGKGTVQELLLNAMKRKAK